MVAESAGNRMGEFCDVFCEKGVFDVPESEAILKRARDLGLKLKVHADELSPLGGAELAAHLGAVSADHLLCGPDAGPGALAKAGTVTTRRPGRCSLLG